MESINHLNPTSWFNFFNFIYTFFFIFFMGFNLPFCRDVGTLHWWGSWLLDQWNRIKQQRCLCSGRNGGLLWCLMGSFQILKFQMNWELERSTCRACLRINTLWWLSKQADTSLPRIRFNSRVIASFKLY